MSRTVTDEEAREIAAKWRGLSGPFTAETNEDGDWCVEDGDGTSIARVEDFDEHSEPIARLLAGAPRDVSDLAGTVIAQAAQIARLKRRMETMPPWQTSQPPTDEEMHAIRMRWAFGPERYQADADALIAAVIVGRREQMEAAATIDRLTAEASTAADEIARLREALAASAAIIAGRTTPPTDAEIAAHGDGRGLWIFCPVGRHPEIVYGDRASVYARSTSRAFVGARWIAAHDGGRPCAWPVVEVSRG